VSVDRDKVLQAAQKLVEKKKFDKAIVEYQKLVADDPKDVRTLLKIGDLHLKIEEHVEAITTYERVGEFYVAQGFGVKAIAVYKQIREIVHKYVPHLEDRFGHVVPKLAEIYTQLGLTSDALAAYDEVATRFQRAGRDRDAIDVFRKVVELDPSNPLPYLRLAEAFIRVRDVDNAMQRFGSAAEILLKLGRRDDALKVVERLLQHRQDPKFARIAAEIYLERKAPNDGMAALTKLQIAFKDNPKDLDTLALLARAFDTLGQPAKSIEVMKEAARISRDAGRDDLFEELITSLLERAPNDEVVRQLVALRGVPSMPPAPAPQMGRASMASIDVQEEVEIDLDEPESEAAAPFALRPSQVPDEELDPVLRVRRVLAAAEGARRARDYDQSIAILLEAIAELPGARELREKICDVLIEAGEQAEALRQMLDFARWQAEAGDVEGAARVLDEALLIEPANPDALAMLRDLGYAVPGQDEVPNSRVSGGYEYQGEDYGEPYPEAPDAPHPPGYDPNAPLPSYDLEEISAVEAMQRSPRPQPRSDLPMAEPAFAGAAAAHIGDAPLPSFQLEEDATQFMEVPPSMRDAQARAPFEPVVPPPRQSIVEAPPPSQQLDEEALEEVEFFATHGMLDEARALLDEQLSRLPNHPLLLERKREIEAMASVAAGSGTRAVPRSVPAPSDRAFDIAASLDALDALDTSTGHPSTEDDPRQISVETVFEQFKQGVASQVAESDASTHYDLGVAYKEMGLFHDAIHEFVLAARDPFRECVCQSMIGMIFLQVGNPEQAIDAFLRGLHAMHKTHEQERALTYEIGDAYDAQGIVEQAAYYFQRLARIDPNYSDPRGGVIDRLRRIEPKMPRAARAVGAEMIGDEVDAALDDLLGGGKLP
jgi:tetratricopeptide (TPR) repeat protein